MESIRGLCPGGRARRIAVRRVAAVLLCLDVATAAEANAGLPMLAVVWPVSWKLLLPVAAVEALIALTSQDWSAAPP